MTKQTGSEEYLDRYAEAQRNEEIQAIVDDFVLTADDVVAMMGRVRREAYDEGYERGLREGKYQRQKEK